MKKTYLYLSSIIVFIGVFATAFNKLTYAINAVYDQEIETFGIVMVCLGLLGIIGIIIYDLVMYILKRVKDKKTEE